MNGRRIAGLINSNQTIASMMKGKRDGLGEVVQKILNK